MASINYPVTLPCPNISGNSYVGSETFDVSQFDYSIRRRLRSCGAYVVSFSFTLQDDAQMKAFRDFYYTTLQRGMNTFNASWLVEGDETSKEFRFLNIYKSATLGKRIYRVTANFEMITKIGEL